MLVEQEELESLNRVFNFGRPRRLLELFLVEDKEMIWIWIKYDYLVDSNQICLQVISAINRPLEPSQFHS